MELSSNDVAVLRELAAQYFEIAALPRQKETRALWLALNHCRMQRPMVVLDQIPWHEMDVDGLLENRVQHPYWREVETELRRTLYRHKYMPVDMVVNPYITLPRPIEYTGYGLGVEEETAITDEKNTVISHKFTSQLRQMEDLEKLGTPKAILHRDAEAEIRQQAGHIFAGIGPFVMVGLRLHSGLWDFISQWITLEEIYIDLIDRPEFLHAVMEKLTTATVELIEQMNRDRLFDAYTNVCHCSYTFREDLPAPGADLDYPTSRDTWIFGLAQLFTSVSPAVTAEFEVPYMQRIFPYFGAVYYGCCDRLDDRLDIVTQLPNIRKISCSPWSNREAFAEKLPKGYVMSNKPNPSFLLGGSLDTGTIRADIRRTISAAKAYDAPLEMILKDISTLQYQPQRLWEWASIAMEEVQRGT